MRLTTAAQASSSTAARPSRTCPMACTSNGSMSELLGRDEPLAQGALRDRAGVGELEQVVGTARLRPDPRQARPAEGLAAHDGAGGRPVDVDVPGPQLGGGV